MPNQSLSEIGLIHRVNILMEMKRNTKGLREAMDAAKDALQKNSDSIHATECELGAHTKETGRPEVVIVEKIAVIIPVPHHSDCSTWVGLKIAPARGLPK